MNRGIAITSTFALVLGLYLITLHPFFPLGDSGEFVVAAKTFGVSHPPGAPLYGILSYVTAALPIGTLVTRLNFLSALFGAGATAITVLLVYEMTRKYASAVFAGLLLGISYLFWLYAIIPEVYSLSIFLNLTLLYFYVRLIHSQSRIYLLLTALFSGLSLCVHYINIVTIILVGLSAVFQKGRAHFSKQNLVFLSVSLFVGLFPVLLLPVAAFHHPYSNWGNINNLSSFLAFILRTDFSIIGQSESFQYPLLLAIKEQIPFWSNAMLTSLGPTAALLLFVFAIGKKERRFFPLIFANVLFLGPLLVLVENYPLTSPYPDVALNHARLMQQVHIFALPYLVLLIGLGLAGIEGRLEHLESRLGKLLTKSLSLIFLAILFSLTLWTNYKKIRSARNEVLKNYGENIMQGIHRPTLLITGTEEANILDYLYVVEGRKEEDIRLVTFSLLQHDWYREQLHARYPDLFLPFDHVVIGQRLNSFYNKNLEKFDIIFAPLDDEARQSISDDFILLPYGVTTRLTTQDNVPEKIAYANDNKNAYQHLVGLTTLENDQFTDQATNEVLMSYARSLSNVALTSKKLGDTDTALFFLNKAGVIQRDYYTSFVIAASIYLDRKDLTSAALEYLKILAVKPTHIQSLRNLTIIYLKQQNKTKAMEYGTLYSRYATTFAEQQEAQQMLSQINTIK